MKIKIKKVIDNNDLVACCKIRKSVFGDEENAPETLYIIDKYDKLDTTVNYLLFLDCTPVCTIRYIVIDTSTIKIQRLATLSEYRNNGYASMILKKLENDVLNKYNKIILDSSVKAVKFYTKHNYIIMSGVFYEDNRPHRKMMKTLNN